MRMLILLHKNKLFRTTFWIFLLIANTLLSGLMQAQWVNDPAINNQIAEDVKNPKDIVTSENPDGGVFVVWQDKIDGSRSEIYYQHIDLNGKVSFRADGKRVSNRVFAKEKPVVSNAVNHSTVIIWKEYNRDRKGELYAQRVDKSGFLIWGESGKKAIETNGEIIEYSVATDPDGTSYLLYIEKIPAGKYSFRLRLQKMTAIGENEFPLSGEAIDSSSNQMSIPTVLATIKQEAYMLWAEYAERKNKIFVKKLLRDNSLDWDEKALELSGNKTRVLSYKAILLNSELVYAVWQTQEKEKNIFHQIFSERGGLLWDANGKQMTKMKGNNYNPQTILASDSTIITSWINENQSDRNIFVQKFWLKGKERWETGGVSYMRLNGDQFGQNLVADNQGGVIIAWFDSRQPKKKPDLYAQRINKRGELVWPRDGIPIAVNENSEKSYLSICRDQNDGVIAVFKEKRGRGAGLYSQRIFSNSIYVSEILDFSARVEGDSVKLSWKVGGKADVRLYRIEQLEWDEEGDEEWITLRTIETDVFINTGKYEYKIKPEESGTVYYRVVRVDRRGIEQVSDIARVNYIAGDTEDIFLYQNVPNPFSATTTISFYLPTKRNVRIEIYNSRVEEIKKIELTDTKVGRNNYIFQSDDLPSGVYFYRFVAGNFVDVKKMVIAK